MSSIKELLTQPTAEELKKLQRIFRESLINAQKIESLYPQSAGMQLSCHLHNMAYNAVCRRDEALLEELIAAHEQIKPGDPIFAAHMQYNWACLRIAQHRFEEAIGLLQELDESGSNLHRAHVLHLLVDIYEHLGQLPQAAIYVHKYFEYWPKDNSGESAATFSGFQDMLYILAQVGDLKAVIKYGLERIERKLRQDDYIYFLVAHSYLMLDELEPALKYYRTVFKQPKPYVEAFVNVGEYYGQKLGQVGKQIEYYIRGVRAATKDRAHYHAHLSGLFHDIKLLYRELDDPEKALAYRRKMFEVLGTPLLSDLVTLFSRDPESIDIYRDWVEEKMGNATA